MSSSGFVSPQVDATHWFSWGSSEKNLYSNYSHENFSIFLLFHFIQKFEVHCRFAFFSVSVGKLFENFQSFEFSLFHFQECFTQCSPETFSMFLHCCAIDSENEFSTLVAPVSIESLTRGAAISLSSLETSKITTTVSCTRCFSCFSTLFRLQFVWYLMTDSQMHKFKVLQ